MRRVAAGGLGGVEEMDEVQGISAVSIQGKRETQSNEPSGKKLMSSKGTTNETTSSSCLINARGKKNWTIPDLNR